MSFESSDARPKLQIRKYPNRRYYDATHSRHLTLEEIRQLIREGHDLEVIDSKTGVDITAQVLTQIILELETPKIDSFPVALLLQMIRSNDQWVRDFVGNYFSNAFRSYQEYQKQMERQWRGLGTPFAPFASWMPGMTPGAPTSPPPAEPAANPGPTAEDSAATLDLLARLQRQVEDLERQVASGKKRNKRRSAPRKRA